MQTVTQRVRADACQWGTVLTQGIAGPNERVIELPLGLEVAALDQPGWVLDAGCALNVGGLFPKDLVRQAHLVHLTQAISSERYEPHGMDVSYVSADLRDLRIFADRAFDRTVCISTLEHVGFDNTQYGAVKEDDPDGWQQALRELYRVTASTLLVTVPWNVRPLRCGRWRYFAHELFLACGDQGGWSTEVCYYGRVDGRWLGGASYPLALPSADGFPEKVNQIVCLRSTRD